MKAGGRAERRQSAPARHHLIAQQSTKQRTKVFKALAWAREWLICIHVCAWVVLDTFLQPAAKTNQPVALTFSAQYFRLTLSCSCGRRAAGGGRRAAHAVLSLQPAQTCCTTVAAGASVNRSHRLRSLCSTTTRVPCTQMICGRSSCSASPSCTQPQTCRWPARVAATM